MLSQATGCAVEAAHHALWDRFVDRHGVILDYVGLEGEVQRPTPEDCLLCRPNALSWGAPNENGAFFGGVYLEAAVGRFALTGADKDRERARTIAAGLALLASVGEKPGFIARGVAEDGHSHFPIGSNDQTTPWLYGMWRYLSSDVPDAQERREVLAKLIEVVEVLHACGWRTPCDRPPFDFRNCLTEWTFESAPRLLWLCKMMADLTGDAVWTDRYDEALVQRNPDRPEGPDRLAICRRGMVFEFGGRHSWIASNSVAALRALWELEDAPSLKEAYAEGLLHSAELAAESLPLALQFDPEDPRPFSCNWRVVNELWHEQRTVQEAVKLGKLQCGRFARESPRWPYEAGYVREPLFAAWITSLCPNVGFLQTLVPRIAAAIEHYRWDRLCMSQFFGAELAYYQLLGSGVAR